MKGVKYNRTQAPLPVYFDRTLYIDSWAWCNVFSKLPFFISSSLFFLVFLPSSTYYYEYPWHSSYHQPINSTALESSSNNYVLSPSYIP